MIQDHSSAFPSPGHQSVYIVSPCHLCAATVDDRERLRVFLVTTTDLALELGSTQ